LKRLLCMREIDVGLTLLVFPVDTYFLLEDE
jgi:hypothetical protein